jgi:segregation and condensation protein B
MSKRKPKSKPTPETESKSIPSEDESMMLGDEFVFNDEFPISEDGTLSLDGLSLEGLSLDDLGAAYANAAAAHDPAFAGLKTSDADSLDSDTEEIPQDDDFASLEDSINPIDDSATPESIVEAALFVGHPDNQPLTAVRIASLMRDVSPEEVEQIIADLNESYRVNDQALRIVADEVGYRMTVCPEVESVRRSFLGKIRETRLNQAAIEVLSLVAYQPGITAQKITDQRGRESNSILSQMVRRQLLMIERVKSSDGGRSTAHYYPTERFLYLFGLQSIEDLPQVEEGLRES